MVRGKWNISPQHTVMTVRRVDLSWRLPQCTSEQYSPCILAAVMTARWKTLCCYHFYLCTYYFVFLWHYVLHHFRQFSHELFIFYHFFRGQGHFFFGYSYILAMVTDAIFWTDHELVSTFIILYKHYKRIIIIAFWLILLWRVSAVFFGHRDRPSWPVPDGRKFWHTGRCVMA